MLTDRLECTMVDELARLTGNRPRQSMPLRHIAKALGMKKNAAAAMAEHAEQRGWLKVGVVTAFISQMPGDRLRSRDTSGRTRGFWRGQVPVQSLRDEVFILAPWTKLCQDHGLQPRGRALRPVGYCQSVPPARRTSASMGLDTHSSEGRYARCLA